MSRRSTLADKHNLPPRFRMSRRNTLADKHNRLQGPPPLHMLWSDLSAGEGTQVTLECKKDGGAGQVEVYIHPLYTHDRFVRSKTKRAHVYT